MPSFYSENESFFTLPGVGVNCTLGAMAWRTRVIAQDEATWGVAASSGQQALQVDYITESLQLEIARREERIIRNPDDWRGEMWGGGADIVEIHDGSHSPSGAIQGELQPHGFWPLAARHVLGTVVQSSGSGPYTHVIKAQDTLPTGLSFEKRIGRADGSVERLRYVGGQGDTLHIRSTARGMVSARAGFVFKQEAEVDDDLHEAPILISDNQPFSGIDGLIYLDLEGVGGDGLEPVATIADLELTVENGLKPDRSINGGGVDGQYASGILSGHRQVRGIFSARFTTENWLLYQAYRANTGYPVGDGGTGLAASIGFARGGYSWSFFLPAIRMRGVTPQIAGPGSVLLQAPFTALYDPAQGTKLILTIVNNDPILSTAA